MGVPWEEVPSLAARSCAATHRVGCSLACSGQPSAPERSARAPWPKPAAARPPAHPLCPQPSAHPRRDLLQTEHAALKHLNAKLHELLKERRRDAARASAERQRAAGTGVGLAESRDNKDREHPQP